MEPRRERRPNVRLEELGDFPAAVACGVISSPTGSARKWWRRRDPPTSSWDGLPRLKPDEEEEDTRKPPELDFGTITRKSRLMNRRGRTAMGNNRVFAGSWGISGNDGKEEEEEESARYASDSPSVDHSGGTRHSREVIAAQVSSVGRWLEEIGFGKYAGVFEMHEVDEEALLLLTIQDLKEMGFSAVGPRRKLYEAIRRVAATSEQSSRTPEED